MREIFIKYNPYKLETEVKINGNNVKANSALNVGEKRLQEWIEKLPEILIDECNTRNFKITFYGTNLDYEDLLSVAEKAKSIQINIECEHIKGKEFDEKEKAIKNVFDDIQNGPFEELKKKDLKRAFEMALSSDFEVNVIATMSAGKSTLINALLNKKIMPSKNEACTATVTKIRDTDSDTFRAIAYNRNRKEIEVYDELSLDVMNDLNDNELVSTIEVQGNIPFVSSGDISLVLVDTPGPNNSRDEEHKAATYRMLSESSKTLVMYVLNATQLGVNDDNNLLNHVAETMSVGGKQSKDRFIFVVNKMDNFDPEEDDVLESIERAKKYLEDKGIENPNIYPAAALPALNIRTLMKDKDSLKMKDIRKIDGDAQYLNESPELHLEKYAPLISSEANIINYELESAKESGDIYKEALIHTGILSIESAIKMYVNKYAKTAKIKNIVDTFSKNLESTKIFETTKQNIVLNQDKYREINLKIDLIKSKLKDGEEAKKFRQKIDNINYDEEVSNEVYNKIVELQDKIRKFLEKSNNKITIDEADSTCKEMSSFLFEAQAKFKVELEDIIVNKVKKSAQNLLNQYKQKVISLSKDLAVSNVDISPLKLLNGDLESTINIDELVNDSIKVESVKAKDVWIENEDKRWYKPWTWFDDDGYYKEVYENRKYVDMSLLAQKFISAFEYNLYENADNAKAHTKKETIKIKGLFKEKFNELDKLLNEKLIELKNCTNDGNNINKVIEETKSRLRWIEDIETRIEDIISI